MGKGEEEREVAGSFFGYWNDSKCNQFSTTLQNQREKRKPQGKELGVQVLFVLLQRNISLRFQVTSTFCLTLVAAAQTLKAPQMQSALSHQAWDTGAEWGFALRAGDAEQRQRLAWLVRGGGSSPRTVEKGKGERLAGIVLASVCKGHHVRTFQSF